MKILRSKIDTMGYLGFALFVIIFDQVSKFFIQYKMKIGESIPVIKGIFHITYIENPRTSFGLFEYNTPIFLIAALISAILVILIYKKIIFKKDPFIYIPLTLVLGGAVGNLIDRVRIDGRVIDFIDLRIWPVFNFADSAIVCGMLLLLIHVLSRSQKKKEEEEDIKNIKEYIEKNKE